MKRLSTVIVLVAIAMIVSACGADAPPTVNPVDVQNTAISAAFTMVAQTQAAIPTATLPPPTETPTQTPMATVTPLLLPTLDVTIAPPTATAGGDPCATRVLSKPKGKETVIRVWNTTKVAIRVSMYLNETASHGACGYRSFDISKNNDVVFQDLVQGCYNLWAWSLDAKTKFQVSSDTSCINNGDKWTFEVNTAVIKFVGP